MDVKKYIVIGIMMALCCLTPAKALDVSAHSAILMDGTTGRVLYEKEADEISLIASTTKIMTALVTLEQSQLNATVEIPQEAVGIEGSSMYLEAGERLTVEDLLHGLMLSSGNDAAVALALYVSGSVEEFAALMNDKAEALGLEHTHFANPNGLDSDENYATARDLGALTVYALENPDFLRIVSTKSYQCQGHSMTNHNKLLWQYEGAVGVKTGYTKRAGRILVGGASRNGRTLVSVTIHAPDDWQDHKKLLDLGFGQYEECCVVKQGQTLGVVDVVSGKKEQVALVSGADFSFWLLPEESCRIRLWVPEFLYAPIAAQTEVGTAQIYLEDKLIGSVPVLIGEDSELLPEEKSFWDRLLEKLGA